MLKVGGENVDPMEIEAFLLEDPRINHVAVIGVPDPRLAEVPVAFVIRASDAQLTEEGVIDGCRGRIASFKIPRQRVLCRAISHGPWLAGRLQAWYTVVSFGRLLGEAAAMLGRPDEARAYFRQALDVCHKVRFRPEIALLRLDLAELLITSGADDRAQAFEHLQFVVTEFEDMHMQPSLEHARRLSHKLAEAQSGRSPGSSRAGPRATDAHPVEALTTRERELAGFIARGLSNRDIAAAMVISEGTTEVHVKHILSKLGFRSRAQVAVWAIEHGLPHEGDA